MQSLFLTPPQLADRWNIPVNTLSQWRWNGRGPCYCKMNKRVLYLIQDVEAFESGKRRRNTSDSKSNSENDLQQGKAPFSKKGD